MDTHQGRGSISGWVDGVSKQAPAVSASIKSNFLSYFQQQTLHFLAPLPPQRGLVESTVPIYPWLATEPANLFGAFWPENQEVI